MESLENVNKILHRDEISENIKHFLTEFEENKNDGFHKSGTEIDWDKK